MLRRFIIFIANRSHAWISSRVSAFCVLRAGGRLWPPSDSPRGLTQGRGQSRQAGNKATWTVQSKRLVPWDCVLFLLLLLSFRALILSVTLTISGTAAWRGQQSTCISYQVENGVYYVPKPRYLVYRVGRRDTAIPSALCIFWFSLCSCGMWQLKQHSSLWSCCHPQETHTLVDLLTQICPSLFFEGDC